MSGNRAGIDPLRLKVPDGYVSWTAEQKAQWIWHTLIATTAHSPTSLPPLELPFMTAPLTEAAIVVRRKELDKALTRSSDLMEPGRPKLIHARGAVSMIDLAIEPDSPYTGLLASDPQRGVPGLVRLSLVARVKGKAAYTPALALKLLIDGQPSADVLAMNHTVGQGRDFNLFANTMTNDLTDAHSELRLAQRVMSFFFHRVSRQPRRMVTHHLASRGSDGARVSAPSAPERLVFRPTQVAKSAFADQAGVDFRLVLAELAIGTTLYEVDAVVDSVHHRLGSITTTTPFVSSDGGDRLFFRHMHDPADRLLDEPL